MTINAQTTADDHPMSAERFERVVTLYCGAIQILEETRFADHVELQYLYGATGMLLNHAIAALELAREPRTVFGKQSQFQFTKPLAIPLSVVARTAIESYNALFHTVLNPNAELRETMKLFFSIEGFRRRSLYIAYITEHQEKQKREIREMQRLEPLLKARTTRPVKLVTKQLRLAGFGKQTALELYSNQSQYAHGRCITVLQSGQANEDQLRRRLRSDLASVALALTMTLHHLGNRFQVVRE